MAENAPQTIHWASVGGDSRAVVDELVAAVKASVPEARVRDTVLDVQALLERIEQCRALDPQDVVPVARHHSLWEIRLNDQASGVHIRIYCAELPDLPHTIVALHAHAKFVGGTEQEIRDQQDQAISLAILRLEAGRKTAWGLTT